MNTLIYCVAGYSGGHIIPAYHYAQSLNPNRITFFTTTNPLDTTIIKNLDTKIHHIPTYPLKTPSFKKPLSWFVFVYHFFSLFFKTIRWIQKDRPSRVISTGGIISIPFCLAAFFLRIPIILIELNAIPGKTTRFLAFFATTIHVCFSEAIPFFSKRKCSLISYPMPKQNETIPTKEEARNHLCIPSDKKTILLMGGSQGSQSLNNLFINCISTDIPFFQTVTILHQVGNNDIQSIQSWYDKVSVTAKVFSFFSPTKYLYAASDIVICRAGAGTLFELLHFEKSALIIPLENVADNHQLANALAFIKHHQNQFSLLRQKDLILNQAPLFNFIKEKLGKQA